MFPYYQISFLVNKLIDKNKTKKHTKKKKPPKSSSGPITPNTRTRIRQFIGAISKYRHLSSAWDLLTCRLWKILWEGFPRILMREFLRDLTEVLWSMCGEIQLKVEADVCFSSRDDWRREVCCSSPCQQSTKQWKYSIVLAGRKKCRHPHSSSSWNSEGVEEELSFSWAAQERNQRLEKMWALWGHQKKILRGPVGRKRTGQHQPLVQLERSESATLRGS